MSTSPDIGRELAETAPGAATAPGLLVEDLTARSGLVYRLFIWIPSAPPPVKGFGVVCLLDGIAVFGTAADVMRLREMGFGPGPMPPEIVVAIGYPTDAAIDPARRILDLTPPGGGDAPTPHPGFETGGADRFLDVIAAEILPMVLSRWRTDPDLTSLFGHSLGGLFALHCLFTRPATFTTYVAASPSIWWNERAILAAEDRFAGSGGPERPTRVLMTAGGLEQSSPEPRAGERRGDLGNKLAAAGIVENAAAMAERLSAVPRLLADFVLFPGETHGSVIPAALARGLAFIADRQETAT